MNSHKRASLVLASRTMFFGRRLAYVQAAFCGRLLVFPLVCGLTWMGKSWTCIMVFTQHLTIVQVTPAGSSTAQMAWCISNCNKAVLFYTVFFRSALYNAWWCEEHMSGWWIQYRWPAILGCFTSGMFMSRKNLDKSWISECCGTIICTERNLPCSW